MGAIGNAIGSALEPGSERRARRSALNTDTKINEASLGAISRGDALSKRPYSGYKGPRVAGLSGNEQRAVSLADTGYGQSRNYLDKAGQTIDGVAGSTWNGDTAKQYMNPYVDNVVNNTLRKEGEAYQKNQNQIRGNAARVGAFGGSRATLLETEGTKNHLEAVGDITDKGYSDAFNNAFTNWNQDQNRKLQAAQAYESVGGDLSRMNNDQIQGLLQTGGADRVVRQLNDDVLYSNFIENRDWDVNNFGTLLDSIRTARSEGGSSNASRSNAAGEVVGAVSSIAGYFGGKSGSSSPGYGGGYNGSQTGSASDYGSAYQQG